MGLTANHKKSIGLLGSGEHAKELENMFSDTHSFIFNAVGEQFLTSNFKVINIETAFKFFEIPVIAAVGKPLTKRLLVEAWQGNLFTNLISTKANVSLAKNSFGQGISIADSAVLTSGITLRDHVSINIGSTVSHDVYLDEYTTVSPKVAIGGGTNIGKNCFLGIGSVVIDHLNVCDNVFLAAGAVATRNISSPGVYVGIPARKISDDLLV